MVVKVAGAWELGWSTPIQEYDLWGFPLRDFGVDEFIMAPVSGIDRRVTEYKSLDQAIEENSDLTLVFVDERGEVPLQEFKHPENSLYMLGRASYSPFGSLGQAYAHTSVRIEFGKGRIWPHQAITMVLYDRELKLRGSHSNRQPD